MATTYSLSSNSYEGRYLRLTCTQTPHTSSNTSTINWTLTSTGGSSTYYTTGPTTVKIAGKTVYSKERKDYDYHYFPVKTGSVSGSLTVEHGTTGTKSVSVSLTTAVWSSSTNTHSGTWTLDTIPRYFTKTPTISLTGRTETSQSFSWSTSETCNKVIAYYKKSTASSYSSTTVYNNSTGAKSGSFTLSGLSAGTSYNVYVKCTRKDSGLDSNSTTHTNSTYSYPYVSAVGKNILTIGESQTLTIYNPMGRTYTVYMRQNDIEGTEIYSYTGTETSVTFTPDSSLLYNSIPNAMSGNAVYYCIYSTHTSATTNGTYTVNQTESIPSFNNFTYADINSTTTTVTGNNQYLIKNISTLQVTISTANKMLAKNGASGSKYIATIDMLNQPVAYSESNINLQVGEVANAGTKQLSVTAFDSRGLSKTVNKDVIVLDYAKPVVNLSLSRLNNFESQTTIKINGTYSLLPVENVNKNYITSVEYRYRETGGMWSNWTTVTTTLNNGTFTCNDVIVNLDNSKSFEVEAKATDRLDSNTINGYVSEGEAIFFISTNTKKCYNRGKELVTVDYHDPTKQDLLESGVNIKTVNNKSILGAGNIPIRQDFITANGANEGTFTSTTTGQRVMVEDLRIGNKLTIGNSGIKVGSGVKKIKISGQLYGQKNGNTSAIALNAYVARTRGGTVTNLYHGRGAFHSSTSYFTIAIPTKIVEVQEGDILQVGWWKSSTESTTFYSGYNTFLTAEVVEYED